MGTAVAIHFAVYVFFASVAVGALLLAVLSRGP